MKTKEQEYADAFNGVEAEEPMAAAEMPAEMPVDAPVDTPSEEPVAAEMPAEAPVGVPAEMTAESPVEAEEAMSPEDTQRAKSWEGRLRKREEELSAREAALLDANTVPPAEVGDVPEGESVSAVMARAMELRQDPDFDAKVAGFIEDFGLDTVAMFALLGGGKSVDAAPVENNSAEQIEALANDVRDAFSQMHFAAIRDAHEDFEQVIESDKFQEWVGTMDDEGKSRVMQAVDQGSAGQVIKVLTQYKDWLKHAPDMDKAVDAASSVRSSSPVKLPSRAPASSDDEYLAAWGSY